MAVKTFTTGEVLTSADTNTYLANSGLVYITGGALSTSTTNFVGCFTSTYRDYRIVFDSITCNSTADVYWQLLNGTTPASTDYSWAVTGLTETNVNSNSSTTGFVVGYTGMSSNVATIVSMASSMDIYGPQLSQRTFATVAAAGYASAFFHRTGFSHHNVTTAYDGIRILTGAAPTLGGNVSIYGYRKA